MTTTAPLNPAPRIPSPVSPIPVSPSPLPPSARDFEIFEQNQIDFLSTRRVAENHRVSQTRVRQIVTRVADWLAAHLPPKTEAQKEVDVRFAQHLAAAQLRRQIEQCQNYFDGSGDPKYLRHQTRVILALARLGVLPGAIDSLAADCSDPASQIDSAPCPLTPDSCPLPPDPSPLPPDPSLRACSPSQPQTATDDSHLNSAPAVTPAGEEDFGDVVPDPETTRAGLQLMERRLLTLLDTTPSDNLDRRHSLQSTLADIRSSLASLELRLSPDHPGAAITSGEIASPAPTTPPFPSHQSITLSH